MTILQSSAICDDAGTNSDPSDDTYTINVNASAVNGGVSGQFNVYANGVLVGTYDYNTGGSFMLPADGTNVTLVYEDVDDSNCTDMVNIGDLTSCSSNCVITPVLVSWDCDDNGTGTDATDDFYSIVVDASAANGGASGQFNVLVNGVVVGTYDYNMGGSFTLPADGTTQTLVFEDADDSGCTNNLPIGPLEPCSADCIITILQTDIQCSDNGTSQDPLDDIYTIIVNATATNGGASGQFNVLVNGVVVGTYDYNVGGNFTLPADASNVMLVFEDVDDSTCTNDAQIGPLTPCSDDCLVVVNSSVIGDCDDNGTGTINSDDIYNVTLVIDISNSSSTTYNVSWNGNNWGPFTYGVNETIGGLPADGNTITLIITDDSGNCMTTVDVSQDPCSSCDQTVNAGMDQTISCTMSTVTLNGTSSEIGDPVWTDEMGVEVANTLDFTTGIPGTYTLTVTYADLCTATDQVVVDTDNSVPVADAGQNMTITCTDQEVTLGGVNSTVGNGIEYIWTDASGMVVGMGIDFTTSTTGTYFLEVIDTNNNCNSPLSMVEVIDGTNLPSAVIYSDPAAQINCLVSAVTLTTDNEFDVEYEWISNDLVFVGPSIVVNTGGMIYLTALDTITGCSNLDSILIEDNVEYPIINIAEPEQISCTNLSVEINADGSQMGSTISYQWYDINNIPIAGETSNTLSVTTGGFYILELVDSANNCVNQDTVYVDDISEFPIANANNDQSFGCDDEVLQLSGAGSDSGGNFEYNWSTEDGSIVSGGNGLSPTIDSPGTYVLQVLNIDNGCSSLDTVFVDENLNIPTDLLADINGPCEGETNGQYVINSIIGGTGPYTYIVNGQTSGSGVFSNLAPGSYDVQVIDADGCEFFTDFVMPENTGAQNEITGDNQIEYGETTELNLVSSLDPSQIASINWVPADSVICLDPECFTVEFVGQFSTNMFVDITDINGCTYRAALPIAVNIKENIYIPNIISANDDGNNDIFFVQSDDRIEIINSMRIYDRWGELIHSRENFQPNDPTYGWDGTFKTDKLVVPGVYVYLIEYTTIFGQEEIVDGDVTVVK